MGAVSQQIPSAVPSAVTPASTVPVNQRAQRKPYTPPSGKSVIPYVPGGQADPAEIPWQPSYATAGKVGAIPSGGSAGAPSVPAQDTAIWTAGPIDLHYMAPSSADPYGKVNNPPTRGLFTFVKTYLNHVFNGKQDVDNAGWQQNSPQQRTSYMRVTPPPLGAGYAPEIYAVHLNPQQPRTYRFNPTTGRDLPRMVPGQAPILNSYTYGAGQTAGGQGGNNYAPPVPPPDTTPVAQSGGGYPVWG